MAIASSEEQGILAANEASISFRIFPQIVGLIFLPFRKRPTSLQTSSTLVFGLLVQPATPRSHLTVVLVCGNSHIPNGESFFKSPSATILLRAISIVFLHLSSFGRDGIEQHRSSSDNSNPHSVNKFQKFLFCSPHPTYIHFQIAKNWLIKISNLCEAHRFAPSIYKANNSTDFLFVKHEKAIDKYFFCGMFSLERENNG